MFASRIGQSIFPFWLSMKSVVLPSFKSLAIKFSISLDPPSIDVAPACSPSLRMARHCAANDLPMLGLFPQNIMAGWPASTNRGMSTVIRGPAI